MDSKHQVVSSQWWGGASGHRVWRDCSHRDCQWRISRWSRCPCLAAPRWQTRSVSYPI